MNLYDIEGSKSWLVRIEYHKLLHNLNRGCGYTLSPHGNDICYPQLVNDEHP